MSPHKLAHGPHGEFESDECGSIGERRSVATASQFSVKSWISLGNTHLRSVGASPPVNPLHPCVLHTLAAQSTRPLYCRLEASNESVWSFDLSTSTGYILQSRVSILAGSLVAPRG